MTDPIAITELFMHRLDDVDSNIQFKKEKGIKLSYQKKELLPYHHHTQTPNHSP